MGERKKRIGGTGMKWYAIGKTLTPLDRAPESGAAVVLLNSDELAHETALPGLEAVLHHTPSARDAHVCKGGGALQLSERNARTAARPQGRHAPLLRLSRDEGPGGAGGRRRDGRALFEAHRQGKTPDRKQRRTISLRLLRTADRRDLHRLEEIEDRATALEERVLAGELEEFSTPMSELRKETMAWYRYYSQLDDVACELRENENGYFSDEECGLFRLFEERVIRLREESQLLREYCTQIQSLFQSEIDIRQNRIMQILTIVTTIFLPLTLLVGWYGMNFSGMPELHWKYGYPAIILVSVAVVVLSLWVCKKKKILVINIPGLAGGIS